MKSCKYDEDCNGCYFKETSIAEDKYKECSSAQARVITVCHRLPPIYTFCLSCPWSVIRGNTQQTPLNPIISKNYLIINVANVNISVVRFFFSLFPEPQEPYEP